MGLGVDPGGAWEKGCLAEALQPHNHRCWSPRNTRCRAGPQHLADVGTASQATRPSHTFHPAADIAAHLRRRRRSAKSRHSSKPDRSFCYRTASSQVCSSPVPPCPQHPGGDRLISQGLRHTRGKMRAKNTSWLEKRHLQTVGTESRNQDSRGPRREGSTR